MVHTCVQIANEWSNRMKIIGLTGSIATGKTTVTQMLKAEGVTVIDADEIAAQITQRQEVLDQLVEVFGTEIVANNTLNRRALATIIFTDEQQRYKLNTLLHPLVKIEMLKQAKQSKKDVVVFDVPLLYETDFYQLCELIIVVAVDEKTQLHRLMERDQCTYEQAMARITAQIAIDEKIKYADFCIDNSRSKIETNRQVRELIDKLNMI